MPDCLTWPVEMGDGGEVSGRRDTWLEDKGITKEGCELEKIRVDRTEAKIGDVACAADVNTSIVDNAESDSCRVNASSNDADLNVTVQHNSSQSFKAFNGKAKTMPSKRAAVGASKNVAEMGVGDGEAVVKVPLEISAWERSAPGSSVGARMVEKEAEEEHVDVYVEERKPQQVLGEDRLVWGFDHHVATLKRPNPQPDDIHSSSLPSINSTTHSNTVTLSRPAPIQQPTSQSSYAPLPSHPLYRTTSTISVDSATTTPLIADTFTPRLRPRSYLNALTKAAKTAQAAIAASAMGIPSNSQSNGPPPSGAHVQGRAPAPSLPLINENYKIPIPMSTAMPTTSASAFVVSTVGRPPPIPISNQIASSSASSHLDSEESPPSPKSSTTTRSPAAHSSFHPKKSIRKRPKTPFTPTTPPMVSSVPSHTLLAILHAAATPFINDTHHDSQNGEAGVALGGGRATEISSWAKMKAYGMKRKKKPNITERLGDVEEHVDVGIPKQLVWKLLLRMNWSDLNLLLHHMQKCWMRYKTFLYHLHPLHHHTTSTNHITNYLHHRLSQQKPISFFSSIHPQRTAQSPIATTTITTESIPSLFKNEGRTRVSVRTPGKSVAELEMMVGIGGRAKKKDRGFSEEATLGGLAMVGKPRSIWGGPGEERRRRI
ncbi:hypothetical protein BC829DRAFT_403058 [Chytridium lagenaria]|nr:hypothetical protein BC829DRAFT_403058 [Chytridium lagenaria]